MRHDDVRHLRTFGALAATVALAPSALAHPQIDPYAVSIHTDYEAVPLLSVGDRRPVTDDPSQEYQMIGIPDGLGAHSNPDGTVTVLMSHGLENTTMSEPFLGGPLNRGAFVSKLILAAGGRVLSADRAYDTVFINDLPFGPAGDTTNATPGFGRFCSGSLADRTYGFDRPIYFATEEGTGTATFGGIGGHAVAIFDNEAHVLTWLGRFSRENSLVQPRRGPKTVIVGLENGAVDQDPALDNSHLYLYIGDKDESPGATVLERNGLVDGTLFVFRSTDPTKNSEQDFQSGSLLGEWFPILFAQSMSAVELEAASDAAGAMVFARPEDGCFNPRNKDNFFFVTTGGAIAENKLGRLYSMRFTPFQPGGPTRLTILYNADNVVALGDDIALSPDNIDASQLYLTICEDGTDQSRPVMEAKGREASIWRFALYPVWGINPATATRIVELDPPGRDGIPVGTGIWETSGIIDTSKLFGTDTWLFDVQAHAPTTVPFPNTVEDGQLLLLKSTLALPFAPGTFVSVPF